MSKKHLLRLAVDEWMSDSFMHPWRRYLEGKEQRGEVVNVQNVKVDGPAMFGRPFCCDSRVCSPGMRKRGQHSCCADLDAAVTPAETQGLRRNFAAVDKVLRAREPRWAKKPLTPDECFEEHDYNLQLKKRGGRCVLSYLDEDGAIKCGVHSAAMELGKDPFTVKPLLCSIFPLVIQDMLDGTYLLTILDGDNGTLVGFTSHKQLPCLHGEKTFGASAPPAYHDFLGTLSRVFGERFVTELDRAGRDWRAQQGLKTAPLRLRSAS